MRARLSEVAQANGKPELADACHNVIKVFQEVLDKESWVFARRGMLPEDAPWLRLTWPHDGREPCS